jgi:hypothetical protein
METNSEGIQLQNPTTALPVGKRGMIVGKSEILKIDVSCFQKH